MLNLHTIAKQVCTYLNQHAITPMSKSPSLTLKPFDIKSLEQVLSTKNAEPSKLSKETQLNDQYISYTNFSTKHHDSRLKLLTEDECVIIFDNRSGYINATKLIERFKDDKDKSFSKLSHNSLFVKLCDTLDNYLNTNELREYADKTLPQYSDKQMFFKSMYELSHVLFGGWYVHPCLVSTVLSYANVELMTEFSLLSLGWMLEESHVKQCFGVIDVMRFVCEGVAESKSSNDVVDDLPRMNVQGGMYRDSTIDCSLKDNAGDEHPNCQSNDVVMQFNVVDHSHQENDDVCVYKQTVLNKLISEQKELKRIRREKKLAAKSTENDVENNSDAGSDHEYEHDYEHDSEHDYEHERSTDSSKSTPSTKAKQSRKTTSLNYESKDKSSQDKQKKSSVKKHKDDAKNKVVKSSVSEGKTMKNNSVKVKSSSKTSTTLSSSKSSDKQSEKQVSKPSVQEQPQTQNVIERLLNPVRTETKTIKSLAPTKKQTPSTTIEDKAIIVLINPHFTQREQIKFKFVVCPMSMLSKCSKSFMTFSEAELKLDVLDAEGSLDELMAGDRTKLYKQVPEYVLYRTFLSLRSLPCDIAKEFNHDFEDEVNVDIDIDPNTRECIVLMDSVNVFDECFVKFVSQYMVI